MNVRNVCALKFFCTDGSTYQPLILIHHHHGNKETQGSKEDCQEGEEDHQAQGRKAPSLVLVLRKSLRVCGAILLLSKKFQKWFNV
jgi:hypothetical protein